MIVVSDVNIKELLQESVIAGYSNQLIKRAFGETATQTGRQGQDKEGCFHGLVSSCSLSLSKQSIFRVLYG